MIKLLTYQANPYFLGEAAGSYLKPNSGWMRDIVNQLIMSHQLLMTAGGIGNSFFTITMRPTFFTCSNFLCGLHSAFQIFQNEKSK